MSRVARFIATAAGAGYSPVAPGTAGTAVAVPIAWLLAGLAWWQFALVTAAVTAIGIWAAAGADRAWGTHDSGRIVIDEVAGYLLTVALVDRSNLAVLLVGFVLFRVLDVVKLPPARWIDRTLEGGAGVMLDDIAAGAQACAIMVALDAVGAFAALTS